ncbi:hypothetical protein OE749_11575 [Aestuariibacter sp. AA17]|uniref:DUF4105 domain-containing protein n=1 Tax=Fluctibacter corallii TaxID=2984329 RepID=A0ABT3A9H6_9ALTE|nr:hypothetical protein [Aestuariibacter sp. AA17]MCV2885333.1 hypothetical protein [Aestuariibacter sp. AA17]
MTKKYLKVAAFAAAFAYLSYNALLFIFEVDVQCSQNLNGESKNCVVLDVSDTKIVALNQHGLRYDDRLNFFNSYAFTWGSPHYKPYTQEKLVLADIAEWPVLSSQLNHPIILMRQTLDLQYYYLANADEPIFIRCQNLKGNAQACHAIVMLQDHFHLSFYGIAESQRIDVDQLLKDLIALQKRFESPVVLSLLF